MLRQWSPRQVKLKASSPITYEPSTGITNSLMILNLNTAATIYVGQSSKPSSAPEWKVSPGGVSPVILPTKGASTNIEADADCTITVIEIASDSLDMVLSLQVVMTQIANAIDMTDRAGRAVGKVGLQVASADVSSANPVYTRRGIGVASQYKTAAGAGDVSFKGAAGRVFAAIASVDGYLKDGAGNVFYLPAKVPITFDMPIECATSIAINLTAAGNCSCQFE